MHIERVSRAGSRLVLLVACLWLAAPAQAAKIVFTVVPAQSEIAIQADSVLDFGFPTVPPVASSSFAAPGTPGATLPSGTSSDGRRTSLSGSIFADVVAGTSIGFAERGTTLRFGNAGSFLPGNPSAFATPAAANLAASFAAPSISIAGGVALRNAVGSIQAPAFESPAALAAAGAGHWTFAGPVTVALVEAAIDATDTASNATRRVYVALGMANSSSGGTLEDLPGGGERLTLPVDALATLPYQHGMGAVPIADVTLHLSGQLVAVTAPEPGATAAALLAIALLGSLRFASRRSFARLALLLLGAAFSIAGECDQHPPAAQDPDDPNDNYFESSDGGGETDGTADVSGMETVDSIPSSSGVEEVATRTDANGSCSLWIDGFRFDKEALDVGFWCECNLFMLSGLPGGGTIHTMQQASFSTFGTADFDSAWAKQVSSSGVGGASPMITMLSASVSCIEPNTTNVGAGSIPDSGELVVTTPIASQVSSNVFCTITADFDCQATSIGHSFAYGHVFQNRYGNLAFGTCQADEQCAAGEYCTGGSCGPNPYFCESQSDCDGNGVTGQQCVSTGGPVSICTYGTPGDPCEIDSQCATGNHCVDSGGATPICTQGNRNDPCEVDADCDGGICEQNLCQ